VKRTYELPTGQSTDLQRRANTALRRAIVSDMWKVQALVATYGPSCADIFRAGGAAAGELKAGPVMKFADDNGNGWVGRGPRPPWLRDALSRGRSVDEFRAQ